MSNKLVKEKTIEKEKKDFTKLKKFIKNLLLSIIFFFLMIFCIYQYYHYTKGFTIYFQNYNIQNEYARFLIELNDEFIECMIDFDSVALPSKDFSEYTDFEKEKLSNLIVAEGNIISRLDNTPPDENNLDYKELQENILESYALYVQGQIMKLDYIYQTDEGMQEERFTIGDSLTSLIGNFIIEYNTISNSVRNTNYDYKYSAMDGFDIITGDFEQEPATYDENGNLIIDEDKNYLYLPEQNVNYGTKEEQEDLNNEIDGINQYINDYFKIQENYK